MLRLHQITFHSFLFSVHSYTRKTEHFPFIIYAGSGKIINTKKAEQFIAPCHFITLYNGNLRPFSTGAPQPVDSAHTIVAFQIAETVMSCPFST